MHKWLLPEPDEHDLCLHAERFTPELMTRRCHENVPVIEFVGGRVVDVGIWGATGEIPLLEGPMNQNAIQLASNHYLLADFVVAVAIVAALPGVSVIGFHEPDQAAPVQVWTTQEKVEHLAAGTGTITASCRPEASEVSRIGRELVTDGQSIFETTVDVMQGTRVVSRISLTQLVLLTNPREVGQATNMIQAHAHKVSALLIAGLRQDELSQEVAGPQGRALAVRMSRTTPQLPTLVQARTAHLDDLIIGGDFRQILVVGIGLDTRRLRLNADASWFGVDLEPGIRHRRRHFSGVAKRSGQVDPTCLVAGDVRDPSWLEKMNEHGFDASLPTLIVVEGLSMYLNKTELDGLLGCLASAAESAESKLWIDHVTQVLLDSELSEAREFLSTMARMGEPFIHGFDNPETLASGAWELDLGTSAANVSGIQDALHEGYRFSVMCLEKFKSRTPEDD